MTAAGRPTATLAPASVALSLLLASPLAAGVPRQDLESLPPLATEGFEIPVVEALEAARARVEELSSDPDASDAELAEAFGELAMVHHAHDLLAAARIGYRNAELLATGEPRWPYLLGCVELDLGHAEAADRAFARALEIDPENVSVLVGRARLRRLQGRSEEAIETARRAIATDPQSVAAHVELGHASLDAGEFAAARDAYEWLLARQPDASRLITPLADAYRGLGEAERAAAVLRRRGEVPVRVSDPWLEEVARRRTGSQAALERGSAAWERGDLQGAVRAFGEAVEADPSNAAAQLNLGAALIRVGRSEAARAALSKARELEPTNPTAALNLAALSGREGDFESAIRLYRESLELAPSSLAARSGLARTLLAAQRPGEALSEFRLALERAPEDVSLVAGELLALHALGRAGELGERLDRALAEHPDDGRLLAIAVRLLAASPHDAVRDGTRALAVATRVARASRSVATLELLAMAYAETGDFERAAATIVSALAAPGLDTATRARLEADLARYRRLEPLRDPGFE